MDRSCRRSVRKVLDSPKKSFYESEKGTTRYFDLNSQALQPVPEPPGIIILKSLKDRSGVVQKNAGASLIDLGDGVLCCEFHSKMNSIGGDLVAMIHAGISAPQLGLRRHGHRQSSREFFSGREPDAGADQRARRRMGRYPHGRAPIPARQYGHQVRAAAHRRRTARHGSGRRLRSSACTPRAFTPQPKPTWAWWRQASA